MADSAETHHAPEVSIVLVRPREEGNIGSVARAMANMGLADLILIEPAADLGGIARGFGVGGWSVLDGSRRFDSLEEALSTFELAIGTSSGRERPFHHHRVLDARSLATSLPAGRPVALVFGPENNGLKRDELEQCDLLVTIPCAAEHPTLNLAQAVLLVAYEIHMAQLAAAEGPELEISDTQVGERRLLIELTRPIVTRLGFDQEHLREAIVQDLRTLLRRARPDRRQLGVLRRLIGRVAQLVEGPTTAQGLSATRSSARPPLGDDE